MHRVLVVDDQPEVRLLVRTRLGMLTDLEVVGEASNGAEALALASALAPDAVVLDREMPVMRGDEAIPLIRQAAPGVRIMLYTGAPPAHLDTMSDEARPDVVLTKGSSLNALVEELRRLVTMSRHDVLRVELPAIPLPSAVAAFDTWVGANVRILDALARGEQLVTSQLGGATLDDLRALIGVYAHLGDNLQKAAREGATEVTPVIHVFRSTAAAARRALVALTHTDPDVFYASWNLEIPPQAVAPLSQMRSDLIAALPTSSADASEGEAS